MPLLIYIQALVNLLALNDSGDHLTINDGGDTLEI